MKTFKKIFVFVFSALISTPFVVIVGWMLILASVLDLVSALLRAVMIAADRVADTLDNLTDVMLWRRL